MQKENFLSEAPLKEKPQRPISLKIKDGSITTSKIADKAVTPDKLAVGVGTPNGFATLDANGNVPLSQLGNINKRSEISLEELDSLCTMDNVESPGPVMYSVTKNGLNIGVLLLFSGSKDYTVTQVFITHCVWEYGELVIESDNHIYQYYRSYESNASSGGSWNEWQPFIDGNMISVLENITRNIKQNKEAIDAIRPMENEVIDGIWEETNVL